MSDTTVTSTLNDAVFTDGASISGTWTDTYDSAETLTSVSDVVVTLTNDGTTEVYSTGTVYHGGGESSNFNYEIELTASDGSKLFLDWENGVEEPASLYTGTVTVTSGTFNGNSYSRHNPYYQYTSYQPASGGSYALEDGGTVTDVTCFLAGTKIRTVSGEVAVETLKAGDMVLTAAGQAVPVRWLGRSTIAGRFADPLRAAPVLIKAGALGEALPRQDLRVSPAHALFLDGVLVEAGALVNGLTILREEMADHFVYYHVELASHDLLISNGVASESFVDNAGRMNFDNWNEHEALGAGACIAEMDYPRVKAARQLPQGLRARLMALRVSGSLIQAA
ncbi:Hint domain-containing protein [Acidocella sp.]|uniref:Hint domain-containing protein n=1 Tax=Acidocella sp. TaxID=50710 RepID=UPI003CFD7215